MDWRAAPVRFGGIKTIFLCVLVIGLTKRRRVGIMNTEERRYLTVSSPH